MEISWQGTASPSIERLELDTDGAGITATSTVESAAQTFTYRMELDAGWSFRTLDLRTREGAAVSLVRAADGAWRVGGEQRADLHAARDIDLSFSPFTNTLPIRRLELSPGESADIVAAYVGEDLTVSTDPQRYTRLSEDRYLYESRDSDFRREIAVDAAGIVLDYPGLFRRIL